MTTTTTDNQLQKVFDFEGTQVRTVIIEDEPWFVAKDVCRVLGIKSNNITNQVRKLPEEMRCSHPIATPNRTVEVNCVNEAGLYKLTMRSDKPQAVTFQNWIASEVLPSIRKNGLYMTNEVAKEVTEDTEAFLARALLIAKDKLDRQEAELKAARPKVTHYDNYMDYNGSHSFSDIAALLNIHVNVLTAQLVADGVLKRNIKGELSPRKPYLSTGYFRVKQTSKFIHTRVTPKGAEWILKRYQK